MKQTPFTALVGCSVPIQLAGMGGVSTPKLAAAVSNAGALGMVNLSGVGGGDIAKVFDDLAKRTTHPAGANFLMPFLDMSAVELAAERCRLVEFFYGDPQRALVDRVHAAGALAAWQVGSPEEARSAADARCDLVIAQGAEAGGHVRGSIGMLPLLAGTLDIVDVPVIAAGGIGDGRTMAAALAAGAAGVRIGTRFVAAEESPAHPYYVDALIASGPGDTTLTTAFSVMWPNAPHRVLSSCIDALAGFEGESVGDGIVAGSPLAIPPGSVIPPDIHTTGAIEAMPLYAGQSVGAVRRRQPAHQIIEELVGRRRMLGLCGEPTSRLKLDSSHPLR